VLLAWAGGWGYQHSVLLWVASGLYAMGVAGAAGVDAGQLARLANLLTRGGDRERELGRGSERLGLGAGADGGAFAADGILGGALALAGACAGACWSCVSDGSHAPLGLGRGAHTYSAEAGGLVPAAGGSWWAGAGGGGGGGGDALGGLGGAGAPRGLAAVGAQARRVLRHILEDNNSRRIFYFLCLNFSFM